VCSKRDTYPRRHEFVGRGIEPDIVIHPTVAGLRANRDEVLEKAIEVLGDWGRYEAPRRTETEGEVGLVVRSPGGRRLVLRPRPPKPGSRDACPHLMACRFTSSSPWAAR